MEDKLLTMALTEAPICFHTQGGRVFRLYQPTLGKSLVLQPLLEKIKKFGEGIEGVALSLEGCRDTLCEVLSIYSLDKSSDILDPFKVGERSEMFSSLDDGDLITLYLGTMSWPTYGLVAAELGIDKETERKERIMSVKDKCGSVQVGGVSLYGRLIDAAMERYGWSLQYTLWGISLTNLQLLLGDVISSIYLSKEEMKRVSPQDRMANCEIIDADNKDNAKQIAAIFNKGRRH